MRAQQGGVLRWSSRKRNQTVCGRRYSKDFNAAVSVKHPRRVELIGASKSAETSDRSHRFWFICWIKSGRGSSQPWPAIETTDRVWTMTTSAKATAIRTSSTRVSLTFLSLIFSNQNGYKQAPFSIRTNNEVPITRITAVRTYGEQISRAVIEIVQVVRFRMCAQRLSQVWPGWLCGTALCYGSLPIVFCVIRAYWQKEEERQHS